jgi:Ni2+-binding GTPase involved in maturation of urease and hydrogenase
LLIGYSVKKTVLHYATPPPPLIGFFFYSEDVSANMNALEILHAKFDTQLLLIESGGDNLAANYRYVFSTAMGNLYNFL